MNTDTIKTNKQKPYHYKACGLDNIYLLNGFTYHDADGEKAISFEDIEGLHRVIGLHIVKYAPKLTGKELRFLRKEMEVTQSMLATLLRVSEGTVRRWEKDGSIDAPADGLIRLLYIEHVQNNPHVHDLLEKLSQLDEEHENKCVFVRTKDDGWKKAA